MGGDLGPEVLVQGALRALELRPLLVGREDLLRPLVAGRALPVRAARDVVEMHEPATAPLRAKPDASVRVAMQALADGEARAVVTVGHSGAALAAALHVLGPLPGVTRPALVTALPRSDGGELVILDLGANVDARPALLADFARMGEAYARAALGLAEPRVGLLSNGEERGKGNAQVRAALPLLEGPGLRFHGPVEPTDALRGVVDVLVCDGFVGNVMLKTVEAAVEVTRALMRQEVARHPTERLSAWHLQAPFKRFRERTRTSAYGGALLLGVRGVVVVGHGRSDAEAVEAALRVAARAEDRGVVGEVARAMAPSPA